MSVIGAGISLRGIHVEDFHFPFYLASGITKADEGKAVTLDTTAANTVKLAGDGDPILGRLEVVEVRVGEGVNVGTVALKGGLKLPLKSAETVNVGDAVQGAGSGEVKALAVSQDTAAGGGATDIAHASHDGRNIVVEVGADFVVALLL